MSVPSAVSDVLARELQDLARRAQDMEKALVDFENGSALKLFRDHLAELTSVVERGIEIYRYLGGGSGAEFWAETSLRLRYYGDFNLVKHLARHREFSLNAFGPGAPAAGVLEHISTALCEIASRPDDIDDWLDVVILAFEGAMRAGHEPADIVWYLEAKQARNESRKWPDWRTADPDKAIEHVRDEAAP